MRKFKIKELFLGFGLLTSTFLVGCSGVTNSETGSEGSYKLKLSETHTGDYPTVVGAKDFANRVEEASDGRIEVELYEGSSLGDEKTIIEQMQLGVVDMARINTAPLAEFYEPVGVFTLPYLFDDMDQAVEILTGPLGEEIMKGLEDEDLIGLSYYFSGARNLYNTKKPIESIDDLKGMKIRVQQSQIWLDLMKEFGASPTPVPYSEVYSGLQSGVVDGAENIMSSYYSSKHYEVAKYYTLDQHTQGIEMLVISKKTWGKLSAEDQELILKAAKESVPVQIDAQKAYDKEAEEKVKAEGAEIIELSETELEKFREAGRKLYDTYGENYKEYIDEIEVMKNE